MNRLFLFLSLFSICCQETTTDKKAKEKTTVLIPLKKETAIAAASDGPTRTDSSYFSQQIKKLAKRATKEKFNTQYAIVCDLGLHSGSKRIFIINLQTKKILKAGLVTHGSSTTYQPEGVRLYSNVNGSLCSSLGMYKIGGHYQGQYGLTYKLFGLDAENSNAYARAVVLHSHSCVPDAETDETICQSWGCPTVSPLFLQTLASYIDDASKPMLLYIFDSVKDQKAS